MPISDFIDSQYPKKFRSEEPDDEKRLAFNAVQKANYIKLITEFTNPGKPGYKFKSLLDKMIRVLSLPKPICEEYNLLPDDEKKEDNPTDNDEDEKELIRKIFPSGRMLLIPSFL